MSAKATTDCEHEWEDTGLETNVSGKSAVKRLSVYYCPACRRFSHTPVHITLHANGEWITTRDVRARNRQENERLFAAMDSWLAAHYPEHVEES